MFEIISLFNPFSSSSEWQEFSTATQQTPETSITSIKGISRFFQEKMKLEKHECTTEPMNLSVFLNNVVCIYIVYIIYKYVHIGVL